MLPQRKNHHLGHHNFFRSYWNDDALEHFFNNELWNNVPSANIIENDSEYKIEVAVPGLDKNNFKVEIKNNHLEVSAQKKVNKEDIDKEGNRYLRCEFGYTAFRRVFALPQGIYIEKIKAFHKNGILEIIMPKKEDGKEHATLQISIQ